MKLDTLLHATAHVDDLPADLLERARPSFDGTLAGDPAVIGIDRARRRRRGLALAGVAAAVAVGLVVAPVLGHGSAGSTANASQVVKAAGLTDPLARAQDTWRLHAAQYELVRRCMRAHGLTYYPPSDPYPTTPAAADDLQPSETGYGIQQHIAAHETQPTSRQDTYEATLTPAQDKAYDDVFFGPDSARVNVRLPAGSGALTVSRTGCLAEAETDLYGSVTAAALQNALPQAVGGEIDTAALNDPAYRARLATWEACMRSLGFADDSPDDAVGRLAGDYTNGDPSVVHADEVREAQADLRCDGTGLRDALRDAELRATSQVPQAQKVELLSNEEVRGNAVERARNILG